MITNDYDIQLCAVGDLTKDECKACLDLVIAGGAVRADTAERDFPQALVVAVARTEGKIVAVGTIKPVRSGYNAGIARKSGIAFDPATPEFGYVVVHPDHRDRHLSSKLTAALVSRSDKSLFATTSDPKIKTNLAKAGFVEQGRHWRGRRGDDLSFWIKE